MLIADAFSKPRATWDLVANLQIILEYPYMQHAFVGSAVVAVMTGVIGWFMVIRSQTYVGHTLSMVAFPGATGAGLLGLSPLLGYFAFCTAGALTIAVLAPSARKNEGQSAAVGSVQAFALALGLLFGSMYHGFLSSVTTFLFGSFTGISRGDVIALAVTSTIAVTAVAVVSRPLLFASIDADVARASGIPVGLLSVVFLIILGIAVAETSQFTGTLLVFALLVTPAASAQQLTMRKSTGIATSILIGLMAAWLGLSVAYFTSYPAGFFITTFAFLFYVGARLWRLLRDRSSS